MSFNFKEENKFSTYGYIESNVKKLVKEDIENKDKQVVIVVVGEPGLGKSTLTWWLDGYIRGEYNFSNWAFDHEHWITKSTTYPRRKVVKYDEGRNSFTRRNAMKSENKEALNTLAKYRTLNNVHIINFQNANDMELDLIEYYADLLLRVVSQGWVHGYGRKGNLSSIKRHKYTDRIIWPDWDFRDGFPDFKKRHPDLFQEYKDKKDQNLGIEEEMDEEEEEDDGIDLSEKNLVTVGELADYISVSKTAVYDMAERGEIDMYKVGSMKKFDLDSVPVEKLSG